MSNALKKMEAKSVANFWRIAALILIYLITDIIDKIFDGSVRWYCKLDTFWIDISFIPICSYK